MTQELFLRQYLSRCEQALRAVPTGAIAAVGQVLLEAWARGATVFVAGNGGSASLASHLACDLAKNATKSAGRPDAPPFRVHALADNLAMLTAYANDVAYDAVLAEPLRTFARPGDVLLVVSASGNSPNVVRALEAARELELCTIAWTGFTGGRAAELAQHVVHVPVNDYGVVESIHGIVGHALTAWLTLAIANGMERWQPLAEAAGQ